MKALLWFLLFPCLTLTLALAQEEKKKSKKPIAGKADVMRHVKKHFATFVGADPAKMQIRLIIENKKTGKETIEKETTWPILADAEVKIHGWWGRLEQLQAGDRIWVWFMVDRNKKPKRVLLIADEMSEQDIHGTPLAIKAVEESGKSARVTVHIPDVSKDKVPIRELQFTDGYIGPGKIGNELYAQTAAGMIRHGVTAEGFEKLRQQQRDWLRARWRKEGLPGTATVLHSLGGEMDVLLDHEAIRWGRHLKPRDKVTLKTDPPIKGVVKTVTPWRERTLVRLVPDSGVDILDLKLGQRLLLVVPEPPKEVQASDFPPDIGRLAQADAGKQARIDWFLSTVYCSCGIQGDRCTGMYYVQSSCNVNACGMPNEIARIIGGLIDDGMSDREIFAKLKKERGRDFWQPHLLR